MLNFIYIAMVAFVIGLMIVLEGVVFTAWIWGRRVEIVRIVHKQCQRMGYLVLICVAVLYGGSKPRGGNADNDQNPPAAVVGNGFADGALRSGETTGDTLRFVAIERGTNSTSVTLTWPYDMMFPEDTVDLYVTHALAPTGWESVVPFTVSVGVTNMTVCVPDGVLPFCCTNGCFFLAGTRHDTDCDGLYDVEEIRVWGTSPDCADSDHDGIDDCAEVLLGLNPLSGDTDNDNLNDAFEILILGSCPMQHDDIGDWLSGTEGYVVNSLPYTPNTLMP